MFPVQERGLRGADEELGSVRVGSRVRHRQCAWKLQKLYAVPKKYGILRPFEYIMMKKVDTWSRVP